MTNAKTLALEILQSVELMLPSFSRKASDGNENKFLQIHLHLVRDANGRPETAFYIAADLIETERSTQIHPNENDGTTVHYRRVAEYSILWWLDPLEGNPELDAIVHVARQLQENHDAELSLNTYGNSKDYVCGRVLGENGLAEIHIVRNESIWDEPVHRTIIFYQVADLMTLAEGVAFLLDRVDRYQNGWERNLSGATWSPRDSG